MTSVPFMCFMAFIDITDRLYDQREKGVSAMTDKQVRLLHTPDGVRDICNEECEQKLEVEQRIRGVLFSYGCRPIETPGFEYFDVFGSSVGTTPSRYLYKFFDRDGDTLVLRPDFTPSVARAVSKYYLEENEPVRLCYLGSTFVNHFSYRGSLKETTQMGAELIGEAGDGADAEVLAMVIASLRRAGLEQFQISIGHAGFFEGLVRRADLDEEVCAQLRELISNRNSLGTEKLLSSLQVPEQERRALERLPELFGGRQVLERAADLTRDPVCLEALERLREVYRLLCLYGYERYISFDLGMPGGYGYYTGILFRGYTYGTGDAIVKGGRYDHLLEQFGKKAPATGFVIVIDQLLAAMNRQKISIHPERERRVITYRREEAADAIAEAARLRAEGICVELRAQRDAEGGRVL